MRISDKRRKQAGFSLVELLVTIIVLVIVMAAVFSQINQVQRKVQNEGQKVDLTQQSRDFVDQFARDLHMSGYPTPKIYQNGGGTTDANIAMGLVKATPTSLRLEGDIYGDGKVYSVLYQYFQSDPNDPNCPCLRRSVQPKKPFDVVYYTGEPGFGGTGQDPPVFYTEVQDLVDPNGMAQGLFTYFEASGNAVDVGTGVNLDPGGDPGGKLQLIDAIKVNLSTRAPQFDQETSSRSIVNSISTIAELEN